MIAIQTNFVAAATKICPTPAAAPPVRRLHRRIHLRALGRVVGPIGWPACSGSRRSSSSWRGGDSEAAS